MKTTKRTIPKLLGDRQPRTWRLRVETRNDFCEMTFSNKTHAEQEYQRLRNSSIFSGSWITELVFEETTVGTTDA
jgi:hypothetical protein